MAALSRLEPVQRELRDLPVGAARVARIQRVYADARALRQGDASDVAEYGVLGTWAGGELLREGDVDAAIGVLREVATSRAPTSAVAQSHRLIGQAHLRAGRFDDAALAFEAQVALCADHPGQFAAAGCVSGINQLAYVRRLQGRLADALNLYDRIADSIGVTPPSPDVDAALMQGAVILAEMGEHDAALVRIRRLVARPIAVDLMRRAVAFEVRTLTRLGQFEEGAGVARAAWDQARADGRADALPIGEALASVLEKAGRQGESLDARAEIVAYVDALAGTWGAEGTSARRDLRTHLVRLVEADRFGRPRLAVDAVERLLAEERDPGVRADLVLAQQRSRQALGQR
jgi:tetratricopeptide (TPR) repeat protein